jgi:Uncharacterized conserved protein
MLRARERGLLAVASASGGVGVGAKVLWARAGIGAVAVQTYANPSLGITILEKMSIGMRPAEAMEMALAGDSHREYRQVVALSANSDAAVYTGRHVPLFTGECTYGDAVCIGNTLKDSSIPKEMCDYMALQTTNTSNTKSFVKALVNSLILGHSLRGSKRGDKSIAILIVGKTQYGETYDRIVD